MTDQIGGTILRTLPHRRDDARLGHPAKIGPDPGPPACGNHAKAGGLRRMTGLRKALRQPVLADPHAATGVRLFAARVDPEVHAMRQKFKAKVIVEGVKPVPQRRVIGCT